MVGMTNLTCDLSVPNPGIGEVDGNRTRGHLIESQGRDSQRPGRPLMRRSDGTRTRGHSAENRGRLAYSLNAPATCITLNATTRNVHKNGRRGRNRTDVRAGCRPGASQHLLPVEIGTSGTTCTFTLSVINGGLHYLSYARVNGCSGRDRTCGWAS